MCEKGLYGASESLLFQNNDSEDEYKPSTVGTRYGFFNGI